MKSGINYMSSLPALSVNHTGQLLFLWPWLLLRVFRLVCCFSLNKLLLQLQQSPSQLGLFPLWGWFLCLAVNKRYNFKCLMVKLSIHRSVVINLRSSSAEKRSIVDSCLFWVAIAFVFWTAAVWFLLHSI